MSKPTPSAEELHLHPQQLKKVLQHLLGLRPGKLAPYQRALVHVSAAEVDPTGHRRSNERLEYLGDAVMGLVVADYLYHYYPTRDEGFLTELRAAIVNRRSLNHLAMKIGLDSIILMQKGGQKNRQSFKSVMGNSLEAIIGAVYIDKGYSSTQKFILNKLLKPHIDLEELSLNSKNFKSRVIEWGQRHQKAYKFKLVDTRMEGFSKVFVVALFDGENVVAQAEAFTKKQAEQSAAEEAIRVLQIS